MAIVSSTHLIGGCIVHPGVHIWTDAVLARIGYNLKVCCLDLVCFDHPVGSDCYLGACCLDLVGFDHPVGFD